MDEISFRRWFSASTNKGKYKQQAKVYYSSIKKKKFEFSNEDERFTTPRGKMAYAEASSTKLTKADRLYEVKRSAVDVSRFIGDESHESAEKGDSILANILSQEERLN